MAPGSQNDYEDLLAQWSDLESGLGVILASPESSQQFSYRVLQYDRWMQGLLQRDPDVGLYLLFQLASNSPVGYSASHSLVCAVLCHLIAAELVLAAKERDSLVRAALTMNIAMTAMQDVLANQTERPSPAQQDMIRTHPVKGAMLLGSLGVQDENWLEVIAHHHDDAVDAGDFRVAKGALRLARILKMVDRYDQPADVACRPQRYRIGQSRHCQCLGEIRCHWPRAGTRRRLMPAGHLCASG